MQTKLDTARKPKGHPRGVLGKIICLCRRYGFGPAKISVYLKRYHDVAAGERAEVARGGA
jgi:hypothetical protein